MSSAFEGADKGDMDAVLGNVARTSRSSERLRELALARFERSRGGPDVYLGGANILSYRTMLTRNVKGELVSKEGFDIVVNDVAVHSGSDQPFVARLRQGVLDTNAEALLMTGATGNAGDILARASRREAWVTLRSAQDAASLSHDWPDGAAGFVDDALEDGYVVVAPSSMASHDSDQWACWKVDPKTGMTLGVGRGGWGEGTAEKSVLDLIIASVAMGALMTFNVVVFTFIACVARKVAMGDADLSGLTIQGPTAAQAKKNRKTARDCICGAYDAGATIGPLFFGKAKDTNVAGKIAVGWALSKVGKQMFCA